MKPSVFTLVGLLLVVSGCTEQSNHEVVSEPSLSSKDYQDAGKLLEANLKGLVKNSSVTPNWLGSSGYFWYERDLSNGKEYVLVNIKDGSKAPLFDHEALASELQAVTNSEISSTEIGLSYTTVSDDRINLSGMVNGQFINCNLTTIECVAIEPPVKPSMKVSPDFSQAVYSKNNNLIHKNLRSGDERQLTTDGAEHYSYGKIPDFIPVTLAFKLIGLNPPPYSTAFSPNGKYLLANRVDERKVGVMPYLEWAPMDGSKRPKVHEARRPIMGDRDVTAVDYFMFNLDTGKSVPVDIPQGFEVAFGDDAIVGWGKNSTVAYSVVRSNGAKQLRLIEIDVLSGATRTLIEETSPTHVQVNGDMTSRPNIRILGDGAEIVWWSERDDYGHLYLYDGSTGELKQQITAGDWLVWDILAVDETKREIYFVGGGREPNRDHYFRHLYKASLDSGVTRLLTQVDADHHFDAFPTQLAMDNLGILKPQVLVRPDLGVFIDTYSRVDLPPVTVLRSTEDGSMIAELEQADASALYAAGWVPPVRHKIKAADGVTDIYSVYWAPQKELPGGKHPVLDAAYAGVLMEVAPKNFIEAVSGFPNGQSAYARLGFAVVTTDGRATAMRSKSFMDTNYPDPKTPALDDHISAINQLAENYPEMDLDRVGIYGWSWGGVFSAQAILDRPDFYKVASSGAAGYDFAGMWPGFIEKYIGMPTFQDGSIYRSSPNDKPTNWDHANSVSSVSNLKGKLLIIYSAFDENTFPSQSHLMIDALTKANKAYDLMYIPNRNHFVTEDPYVRKRVGDYFVEHLLQIDPEVDAVWN